MSANPPDLPAPSDRSGLLPDLEMDLETTEIVSYGVARIGHAVWSLAGRLGAQLVQLAGFVVLSRMLGPHDFGVLAIAAIFIGFSEIFTDLGVGAAVVANPSPTQTYLTGAFWANAVSGLLIAALVAPCGTLLAHWFGVSQLRWVLPVLSLGYVVSVSAVSIAILERQFRFRVIAFIDVTSITVGQVTAVALAGAGHGLLGLALIPTVTGVVASGLALVLGGWLPGLRTTAPDVRQLRRYALPLVGFNALTYWSRNIDDLLVGKIFGSVPLAYYARAYQLMLAPVQQANFALGRFLQPAFAKELDRPEVLERRHRDGEQVVAIFGFTVTAVVVPVAADVVNVVFGPAWHPMAALLAILSISLATQVVTGLNGALLRATGDTRLLLRLGALNALIFVTAMALGAIWSVRTVAWGFVIASALTIPVSVVPICRHLGFDAPRTLRAVLAGLPMPLVLFALLCGVRFGGSAAPVGVRLALYAVVVGLIVPIIARRAVRQIRWAEE